MFAALKLDLLDRDSKPQQTDVLKVEAEVLELAREGGRQIVSVRFHGAVREEAGAAPTDFDEVWHLVKPDDNSGPWVIAGIQQRQ
jgi:predicted lipid-binding transport protein (Tim44 family)